MSTGEARPPLIRPVLREALGVYRRYWRFLLLLALAIFVPLGFVEALLEEVEIDGGGVAIVAGIGVALVGVLVGEVLYGGAVAALIAKTPDGETPALGHLLRRLPWARLIMADVLYSVAVIIGLILLIVPGLILLAVLSPLATVIELEDRRVLPAFRRSRELVRGHLWTVLALTLSLTVVGELVVEGTASLAHAALGEGLLETWLSQSVADLIANPLWAVPVVLMTVRLMRERDEAPDPSA